MPNSAGFIDTGLCVCGAADGKRVDTNPALNQLQVSVPVGSGRTIITYRRELISGQDKTFAIWVSREASIDDALTTLFRRYPQEGRRG